MEKLIYKSTHFLISYLQSTTFLAQKLHLQSTCFKPLRSTIYNENNGQIYNLQFDLTPPLFNTYLKFSNYCWTLTPGVIEQSFYFSYCSDKTGYKDTQNTKCSPRIFILKIGCLVEFVFHIWTSEVCVGYSKYNPAHY